MIIPLGYRFQPSDGHLISGYLLKRVMGLPLPCHVILEMDLYGQNSAPSDLFRGIGESNSCYWHSEAHQTKGMIKKTIYVFTKLMKASSNSSRISRRAGCGTWTGQTGPIIIKNLNGQIIGSKKMFTFQGSSNMGSQESTSGSPSGGGYHWIMHEYSLDGIYKNLAGHNNVNNDIVLCKITRCFRERPATIDNNGGPNHIPQPMVTIVDHFSQPPAAIGNNGDGYYFSSGSVHEIPQLRSMENNEASSSSSSSLCGRKRQSDEGLSGCDSKRTRISSPSSPSPLDRVRADLENSSEDLLLYFDEDYIQNWIDCLQTDDNETSTEIRGNLNISNKHSN